LSAITPISCRYGSTHVGNYGGKSDIQLGAATLREVWTHEGRNSQNFIDLRNRPPVLDLVAFGRFAGRKIRAFGNAAKYLLEDLYGLFVSHSNNELGVSAVGTKTPDVEGSLSLVDADAITEQEGFDGRHVFNHSHSIHERMVS
jgi:hypothetical protein